MNELYLNTMEKELIENFENEFSNLWEALQDIQHYVNEFYDGDRWAFLDELDKSCDYFTTSKIMRMLFDFSER